MQRDAAEARAPPRSLPSAPMPAVELALGFAERLSRHVHGRGEPVRERKTRQERQRPPRFAQPLFAPAAYASRRWCRQLSASSATARRERRQRVGMIAGAIEHESQRRPRFAVLRVQPARFARHGERDLKRAAVGRAIGARHLELHGAGVRQPDVRRRLLGHLRQHALEDVARVHDLIALERLERRAPFDPQPMRRQQRVERIVGFAAFRARDVRGKSIAAARVGFDVLPARAFERAAVRRSPARGCCP